MSTHQQEVDAAYKDCFAPIKNESSSSFVLSQAGKAYAKIYDINVRYRYVSGDSFDHTLVYLMTEWISNNVQNRWVKSLSRDSLAERITNQILDYYKINNGQRAIPANKNKLKEMIDGIKVTDISTELEKLSKDPRKVIKELQGIAEKMGEAEVRKGIEKYGSADAFLKAILMFLVLKATLIKKGLQVALASGVGATLLFGTGSLCHAIADSTGVAAIDQVGEGIEMAGDMCLNVCDTAMQFSADSSDFFSDILDAAGDLFSLFG